MTQRHERWTDQLSDYLDGHLDASETEALETHLDACADCAGVLEDLRLVVSEARALGGVEPPRDLWPGIAAALGDEPRAQAPSGVIPLPTARPGPRRRGIFFTLPQLAAASVALAVVSAAATWWAGPGLPSQEPASASAPAPSAVHAASAVTEPPPELAGELEQLEQALAAARDKLDPNTVRILEKNLGVIERAIDESRRALALDPNNAFLRDHLDRAYRDKADYLREAAGIADWAG